MAVQNGTLCKAYYNSGTQGTPVWVEMAIIINCSIKQAIDKLQAACRGAGGIKQYMHGDTDFDVSITICHDNASSVWEFLRDAVWSKTPIHLQIYDDDKTIVGTEGHEATYGIFGWDETQNLSTIVEDALTLAPSYNGITSSDAGIAPTRLEVAA